MPELIEATVGSPAAITSTINLLLIIALLYLYRKSIFNGGTLLGKYIYLWLVAGGMFYVGLLVLRTAGYQPGGELSVPVTFGSSVLRTMFLVSLLLHWYDRREGGV